MRGASTLDRRLGRQEAFDIEYRCLAVELAPDKIRVNLEPRRGAARIAHLRSLAGRAGEASTR